MTKLDGTAKLVDMVHKQHWPHTIDAMEWAKKFNARFPSVPVDDAVGWFANAIMAGYDTAMLRKDKPE